MANHADDFALCVRFADDAFDGVVTAQLVRRPASRHDHCVKVRGIHIGRRCVAGRSQAAAFAVERRAGFGRNGCDLCAFFGQTDIHRPELQVFKTLFDKKTNALIG